MVKTTVKEIKDSLKMLLSKFYPKTKEELRDFIEKLIEMKGDETNLNDADSTEVYLVGMLIKDVNKGK